MNFIIYFEARNKQNKIETKHDKIQNRSILNQTCEICGIFLSVHYN